MNEGVHCCEVVSRLVSFLQNTPYMLSYIVQVIIQLVQIFIITQCPFYQENNFVIFVNIIMLHLNAGFAQLSRICQNFFCAELMPVLTRAMLAIEKVFVAECSNSQYIKPFRLLFNQVRPENKFLMCMFMILLSTLIFWSPLRPDNLYD